MKVLIDTNCLLVAIPRKSPFRWLYDSIKKGDFILAVSTEILNEYAEIIEQFYSASLAENVLNVIINLPNVERVTVFYKWKAITEDTDDNKFVDCAVACGADYLITHDRHFKVLEMRDFPKVRTITIDEFKTKLGIDS